MRNTPLHSLQKLIGLGLLLVPVVFLCDRYLDIPVALFVKSHLYANTQWTRLTSNLPDLLLMVVLLCMLVSLLVYRVRCRRGLYGEMTNLAMLLFWVAPASYLVKALLKIVFGRVNTRFWLQEPGLYGFNWFQIREGCNGFPSGHMLVIVALLAAFWRCYPKTRSLCLVTGAMLGLALVATNYHFVSDVIAGTWFAVLVEAVAFRLLIRDPSQPGIESR